MMYYSISSLYFARLSEFKTYFSLTNNNQKKTKWNELSKTK